MRNAIEIEIDIGRAIDLSLFDRWAADRSMSNAVEIENDIGRASDLSLFDRWAADRFMSNAIGWEARHV